MSKSQNLQLKSFGFKKELYLGFKMTDTLNSYHSMYASLSAEITSNIGKITILSREESNENVNGNFYLLQIQQI